jgi:hypothetical protein
MPPSSNGDTSEDVHRFSCVMLRLP